MPARQRFRRGDYAGRTLLRDQGSTEGKGIVPKDTIASEDSVRDSAVSLQEQGYEPSHEPASEPSGDRVEALQRQVARLAALVEAQQAQVERQVVELAELRSERTESAAIPRASSRTGKPRRSGGSQGSGRASSRRALLQWGGAAAAAAAVAAVASEGQSVHAAPLSDGLNAVIGHVNLSEGSTTFQHDSGVTPGIVLFAADNSSSVPASTQYPAALGGYATGNVSINNGVYGLSTVNPGSGVVGLSSVGVGVSAYTQDINNNNPALQAVNQGAGDGGHFTAANDHLGVQGTVGGSQGSGVRGYASGASSIGTRGETDSGFGIAGFSTSGIDIAAGASGRFYQVLQGFTGGPTSGNYYGGEMIRDHTGELWICLTGTGNGTGSWAKVAHLAAQATSGGAITFLSAPVRLLDTRVGSQYYGYTHGIGPISGGSANTYTLQVSGVTYQGVTIPPGFGAFGNVTAVATSAGGGYLSLLPHGVAFTGTANLAYSANQTVSNFFICALSTSVSPAGALDIFIGGNPTDVVVDIFGVIS